jgi:hypothetical protein
LQGRPLQTTYCILNPRRIVEEYFGQQSDQTAGQI